MAAAAHLPPGSGRAMLCASQVMPQPASTASGSALRWRACAAVSRSRTPEPSAMTNPSRSVSNGRLAFCGSSLRRESTLMQPYASTTRGVMVDSAPPARTTSARPRRSRSRAAAMEYAPVAQAAQGAMFGPVTPRVMAALAAGMLGMILGTASALTDPGPRVENRWNCSSRKV